MRLAGAGDPLIETCVPVPDPLTPHTGYWQVGAYTTEPFFGLSINASPGWLQDCCLPYLKGRDYPDTPEALMRSRFTAYVKRVPQYIVRPTHAQASTHSLWGLLRECQCCVVTLLLDSHLKVFSHQAHLCTSLVRSAIGVPSWRTLTHRNIQTWGGRMLTAKVL